MATLLELAERCEAATGPDADLNYAILMALGWARDGWRAVNPKGERVLSVPDYTASLDAAMTLVPQDHDIQLTQGTSERAAAIVVRFDRVATDERYAATPALALCAAALRARAAGASC